MSEGGSREVGGRLLTIDVGSTPMDAELVMLDERQRSV